MPTERFVARLNEQIGHELAAHNQYLACAIHYDDLTLPQMAAFFYNQAAEERQHALMMVQYLLDVDESVTIPAIEAAVSRFPDVVAPVELALAQEKRVTGQISALMAIAREDVDFTSEQFLQWFLKEQVEEEATMRDLLDVVRRNVDVVENIEEYVARESGNGAAGDASAGAPRAAGG